MKLEFLRQQERDWVRPIAGSLDDAEWVFTVEEPDEVRPAKAVARALAHGGKVDAYEYGDQDYPSTVIVVRKPKFRKPVLDKGQLSLFSPETRKRIEETFKAGNELRDRAEELKQGKGR
jgi:hypothetical protein